MDVSRAPDRGLRRLAVASVASTLALTALGGAVRATDSGLACPTWPGCFSAGDFVPPADLHVWLEHSHRLLAGVVGLLVAALTLWILRRFRHRPELLWPIVAAAVLVNVQAVLGAFVVWRFLRAELVTAHLGLAMVILGCLIAVAINVTSPPVDARTRSGRDRRFARGSAAVAALTFVQVLVGGHVTGTGAGLAYRLDGFPLMDGAVFPAINVATERELYHAAHRTLAYVLALAVVWLAWRAVQERRRREEAGAWQTRDRWLVRLPAIAVVLVVAQIGIGVANIATELSWVTVIPHLTVASWIWVALLTHAMLASRWSLPSSPEPPRTAGDRSEVPA